MKGGRPVRVTRAHPCPICKKGDWCLVGDQFVLCMRVESSRPKHLAGGEIGWLHPLDGNYKPPPQRKEKRIPTLNVAHTLNHWNMYMQEVLPFRELGVSHESLRLLECTPNIRRGVFGFPMKD